MTFNPHVLWCIHRNIYEGRHDEYAPYCYTPVGASIGIHPDLGDTKAQASVYAKRKAHPDALAPGVIPGLDAFDGVELVVERRAVPSAHPPDGSEWSEQQIRMTSSAARSLAAALVRAADIEQGLTR